MILKFLTLIVQINGWASNSCQIELSANSQTYKIGEPIEITYDKAQKLDWITLVPKNTHQEFINPLRKDKKEKYLSEMGKMKRDVAGGTKAKKENSPPPKKAPINNSKFKRNLALEGPARTFRLADAPAGKLTLGGITHQEKLAHGSQWEIRAGKNWDKGCGGKNKYHSFKTVPITVKSKDPEWCDVDLQVDKSSKKFKAGEKILIKYKNSHDGDWVALAPAHASNRNYVRWRWLNKLASQVSINGPSKKELKKFKSRWEIRVYKRWRAGGCHALEDDKWTIRRRIPIDVI